MTKMQVGRRAIWAVAAMLSAVPLRGALAKRQARPAASAGSGGGTSSLI
jgi:hypothetical protein